MAGRASSRGQATRAENTLVPGKEEEAEQQVGQEDKGPGEGTFPGWASSFLSLSGLISASIWVITPYSASLLSLIQGGKNTPECLGGAGRNSFRLCAAVPWEGGHGQGRWFFEAMLLFSPGRNWSFLSCSPQLRPQTMGMFNSRPTGRWVRVRVRVRARARPPPWEGEQRRLRAGGC